MTAQSPMIGQALADAIKLRKIRLAHPCPDCDARRAGADGDNTNWPGRCQRHSDDRDWIGLYQREARLRGLDPGTFGGDW